MSGAAANILPRVALKRCGSETVLKTHHIFFVHSTLSGRKQGPIYLILLFYEILREYTHTLFSIGKKNSTQNCLLADPDKFNFESQTFIL
jgi:hypothetical protein